jgi:surface carbohydrate biosynthesis protein
MLKTLLKKKIFLKTPRCVDLLIFGNTIKSLNLNKKNVYILEDQIFIQTLAKSFYKFLLNGNLSLTNLKEIYFYETIKAISPKVALGNEINLNIFKFKYFFPKKKAIAYQCVQWGTILKERLKDHLKNFKYPLICDYFFVYDKESQNIFNFVKTKFIISGSVRNNEISSKKIKKKKYDIMFISEFRDDLGVNKLKNQQGKIKKKLKLVEFLIRNSLEYQGFILKTLDRLQRKYNLKVCIALASKRLEKKDNVNVLNEKKFLNKYIKKFSIETLSSYQLAECSKISITFMSTLGKELLARNHKVMFVLYEKLKSVSKKYLPNSSGKYWYKGKDQNLLEIKILNLIKMKPIEWTHYLNKKNIGYIFDEKNKKLKNLILNLL